MHRLQRHIRPGRITTLVIALTLLVTSGGPLYALNEEEMRALRTNTHWFVRNGSQFEELGREEPVGSGGAPTAPGDPGGTEAQNKEIARRMLAEYGWDNAEQFNCLDQLWVSESSWAVNAINDAEHNIDLNNNHRLDPGEPNIPDDEHDAYGIPQALPPGKMATVGADWRTNATTQIRWGFNYIRDRPGYGDPCTTWDMKQRQGWY